LWTRMTNDKRFASAGFKRQTPVGRHVVDFVSFPLHIVIDLVPADESADALTARTARNTWLTERDYRVIDVKAVDVEGDVAVVLDRLHDAVADKSKS